MKIIPTAIPDVVVLEPRIFTDSRGFFLETYNEHSFEALGIVERFVQDNESYSKQGVLRGLHFQVEQAQGKLVRAVAGEAFRDESPYDLDSQGIRTRVLYFVGDRGSRLQGDGLLRATARADIVVERSGCGNRLAIERRADSLGQGPSRSETKRDRRAVIEFLA